MKNEQAYQPSFMNVHRDIERYIEHAGQVERRKDGFLVYRGYDAAQQFVIDEYLKTKTYEPLVKYFRSWNWEVGDNDFLINLTDRLRDEREWGHLKKLWNGVISKRRQQFREMCRIHKQSAKVLTQDQMDHARNLLVSSLERLRDFATELNDVEEAQSLQKQIAQLDQ